MKAFMQIRDVCNDGIPDYFIVYSKIVMNDFVPDIAHFASRHTRVNGFNIRADFSACLPNNFKAATNSPY